MPQIVPSQKQGWTDCECKISATSRVGAPPASVFATQFIVYPNKIDLEEVSL